MHLSTSRFGVGAPRKRSLLSSRRIRATAFRRARTRARSIHSSSHRAQNDKGAHNSSDMRPSRKIEMSRFALALTIACLTSCTSKANVGDFFADGGDDVTAVDDVDATTGIEDVGVCKGQS